MRQTILFLLLPLFFAACTSPREAFDNQDYEKAYRLALASLNKGKGGKEERSVLKRSLKNILELEGAESRRLAGNETRTPVYGTVEGNVLIITRTKTVEWEAEAAIDALTPNCTLSSQRFSATTRSLAREIRTSGDERAIPEDYLDAPSEGFREEDDMVEDLLQDLYEQVVRAYF